MTWVEVDGLMAWRRALRERAEKAEAALDRVRALCLPGRASVWIADLRAAIDGVSE